MSYRDLMRRVRFYLVTERRKKSLVGRWLSRRVFDRHLWAWEERGIAVGAGWGAAWAIAPVPMQTLFAVASCVWKRGNVPMGVVMCWLSFPGYQVVVWPIQWWLGAMLLGWGTTRSGASIDLVAESARQIPACYEQGSCQPLWEPLSRLHFGWLSAEFVLGTVASCALFGLLCYGLVRLSWRIAEVMAACRKNR